MPFAAVADGRQLRAGCLRDTRAFAQLSQFLYLFHPALQIEHLDLGQLEAELGQVGEGGEAQQPLPLEERWPLATKAMTGALRIVTRNRGIDAGRLEEHLRRACERYGAADQLPQELDELGFGALGAGDRVRVVLTACELVFSKPDRFRALRTVASMDNAWQLRIVPLGSDSIRRTYWLLCDSRLYRQSSREIADRLFGVDGGGLGRRSQAASRPSLSAEAIERADPPVHRMREADGELWELLCASETEWRGICSVFDGERSKAGRALLRQLRLVAPEIIQRLAKARRQEQQQQQLLVRKRSSRIALREEKERTTTRRTESPVYSTPPSASGSRDQRARRREEARLVVLEQRAEDSRVTAQTEEVDDQGRAGAGDEEDWMFACVCGTWGHNYDDGRAMTACEGCDVWQHLGCALRAEVRRIGRPIDEDDWESVRYICAACRSRHEPSGG
ncbi:hypothetical protein GGF46_004510 [Coemansia sp. RSA 552]|nr:hypothetical protein GGF46_004510 [Coemansia sp. RSA 552]